MQFSNGIPPLNQFMKKAYRSDFSDQIDALEESDVQKLTNYIMKAVSIMRQKSPSSHVSILGQMSSFPILNFVIQNCANATCIGEIPQHCPDQQFVDYIERIKGIVYRVLSALNTTVFDIVNDQVHEEDLAERILMTEGGQMAPKYKPSWERQYVPGLGKEWHNEMNRMRAYIENYLSIKTGSKVKEVVS